MTGEVQFVAVDSVKPGPAVRDAAISLDHVARLELAIDDLPPIVVRAEGDGYQLVDGAHRLEVHRQNNRPEIRAVVVAVDDGDMLLEAVRANITHGLVLSIKERKSNAKRILSERPDLSDGAIAEACGLTDKTVAEMRPCPTPESPESDTPKRTGRDGVKRPTPEAAEEQRRKLEQHFEANPDSSSRQAASATGASKSAAADAKRRLSSVPDQGNHPASVAEVAVEIPRPWVKHRASRVSDSSMDFAKFMDARSIRDPRNETVPRMAASCPPQLLEAAIAAAAINAAAWNRLKADLEARKSHPHMEVVR